MLNSKSTRSRRVGAINGHGVQSRTARGRRQYNAWPICLRVWRTFVIFCIGSALLITHDLAPSGA